MQLQENLVVADRFRLVRMIGRGGMGSVWQAVHIALDQPCAVKFIEGELTNVTDAHARFEREAKAAAQLRSPHVVQILDHGVWQGRPYIAMELLEGEDLGKALQRAGGKLPPAHTYQTIAQVCRALTKAHQAGIVHRDLKPDNIFLVNDDDRQLIKILDFGVAKQTSQSIDGSNTKTGAMLGTPYYMSPEQAQGIKSVDSRSDLWSLAVIVYQCITGRLPFESEALGDLLVKIIVHPIPTPSQIAHVPPGFDKWWAKAAERNPDNRFPTAKDFSNALALALGASSVTDPGTRTPQQLQGTAMMANAPQTAVNPGPFQQTPPPNFVPAQTAQLQTPHPNNPTPHGMVMGPPKNTPPPGQMMHPAHAQSNLASSFSGVEPPVMIPKKGMPIGLIAAFAAFILLGLVGTGFIVTRKTSASSSSSSSSSSSGGGPSATTPIGTDSAGVTASATDTAPVPPPPPPTVETTPSTSLAAQTPPTPTGKPGGGRPPPPSTREPAKPQPTPPPATASAAPPPTPTPTASAKKWTPGF